MVTSTHAPFVLGAIQVLESSASKDVFPQAEILDIIKRISESVISAMDITKLRAKNTLQEEQRRTHYGRAPTVSPAELARIIDPGTLPDFFQSCLNHGW